MAEDTFGGYQCYLVIERQAGTQCPLPLDVLYESGGEMVRQNGILYVDSSFADPYTSFTTILKYGTGDPDLHGWVFNLSTGEGRYYDGSQDPGGAGDGDPDVFWSPMQCAIGRVHNYRPAVSKPVAELPEIGSMRPAALKSGRYSTNFTLDKVWIDTRKIYAPSRTNPLYEQYGFRGEETVIVNEFVNTLKQDYYLVILYAHDLTSDVSNVARTWLFPCCKFEETTLEINPDSPVNCRLTGTATYCRPIPLNPAKIKTYTCSFA